MNVTSSEQQLKRVIGIVDRGIPGPTFVVTGGIHGNEPAGVEALRRVLAQLEADSTPPVRGRLIALAGNLSALRSKQRYVDRDLNRMWLRVEVEALLARETEPSSIEQNELLELRAAVDAHLARADPSHGVVFLDLHSTSADGSPFCLIGDTLANRRIAFALGIPVILGLEESIDGAFLDFMHEHGAIAVGIEGGQHDDPRTVDRHAAAIWLALAAGGLIDPSEFATLGSARRLMAEASLGLPRVVEVVTRHAIRPVDEFRMRLGFSNFDQVQRGELLATDRNGEVRARRSGRILMPLYQGKGDDGFFLAQDVAPRWLALSAWLRERRADRLLPLLPGVRRHPTAPDTLVVRSAVARWQVRNLFHLLGFRRKRPLAEGLLTYSRRREARNPPATPAAVEAFEQVLDDHRPSSSRR